MSGIQSVLKGQPFLLHITATEIPFYTETLMFATLKWLFFSSTNPSGLICLYKKKGSTSKLLSDTEEEKNLPFGYFC